MCGDGLGVHPGGEARRRRSGIAPGFDHDGVDEVFVEVVDVLDHPVLPRTRDGHVVEHREVLDQLAESDAARVRADGHLELGREQQDRQVLVDSGDACRVDLDEVDGPGLEQLLEHDTVGDVLAGGDLDRLAGAHGGVAEDVVGTGRLLDPVRVERRERGHPLHRVGDVPALVGVDGDPYAGADGVPGERQPADVVGDVSADLQLDLGEAVGDGLLRQPHQLVVGVAEPAGRGGVGRVSLGAQPGRALGPARFGGAQDGERLLGGEGVGEVPEVDEGDELLGRHLGQELPDGSARVLGRQVPGGVDDRAGRHVHHALLRAQPAQLRIVGEVPVQRAEVGRGPGHRTPDQIGPQCLDGGRHPLVAAPDGETEAMALDIATAAATVRGIGSQDDVGGRVVGVGVHGVRAVQLFRGRKTDVVDLEVRDGLTHVRPQGK